MQFVTHFSLSRTLPNHRELPYGSRKWLIMANVGFFSVIAASLLAAGVLVALWLEREDVWPKGGIRQFATHDGALATMPGGLMRAAGCSIL